MKKVFALGLLALLLFCAASASAAIYVPKHISEFYGLPNTPPLSSFARMKTKQVEYEVTIYLSQAVESLSANWLEYNNEHFEDLEITEEGDLFIAYLNTFGHKYQVGAHWTNAYATATPPVELGMQSYKPTPTPKPKVGATPTPAPTPYTTTERLAGYLKDSTTDIPFTTDDPSVIKSKIDAARKYAETEADKFDQKNFNVSPYYYCVKVEEPYYAVVRVLDNDQFCIVSRYRYTADPEKIVLPAGCKLYRVNGYATAWHPTYAASDGTSNGRYVEAYYTQQIINGEDWTVVYGRDGKIQWFSVTLYDTEFFDYDLGTAVIKFEPCNTGWFIREVHEQYEDGTWVTAYYSRTGNGKLSFYRCDTFLE